MFKVLVCSSAICFGNCCWRLSLLSQESVCGGSRCYSWKDQKGGSVKGETNLGSFECSYRVECASAGLTILSPCGVDLFWCYSKDGHNDDNSLSTQITVLNQVGTTFLVVPASIMHSSFLPRQKGAHLKAMAQQLAAAPHHGRVPSTVEELVGRSETPLYQETCF